MCHSCAEKSNLLVAVFRLAPWTNHFLLLSFLTEQTWQDFHHCNCVVQSSLVQTRFRPHPEEKRNPENTVCTFEGLYRPLSEDDACCPFFWRAAKASSEIEACIDSVLEWSWSFCAVIIKDAISFGGKLLARREQKHKKYTFLCMDWTGLDLLAGTVFPPL